MVVFIYDDTYRVDDQVEELIGIRRYGDLIRRREALRTHVSRLVSSDPGCSHFVSLSSLDDLRHFLQRMPVSYEPDTRFVVFPAYLAPRGNDDGRIALCKLLYCDPGTHYGPPSMRVGTPARVLDFSATISALEQRSSEIKEEASNQRSLPEGIVHTSALVDIRQFKACVEYMTRSFEARYFNDVVFEDTRVMKRSRDVRKMRREHDYFYLLPHRLQRFFVQPFDFEDHGDTARYMMDRFNVANVAIQWINGGLKRDDYTALLDRVFEFLEERPRLSIGNDKARDQARSLYLDKVRSRLDDLRKKPIAASLDKSIAPIGGLSDLFSRYEALFERHHRLYRGHDVCVSHGDLCFSNILYDKRTGLIKFLDPKGALTEDELYLEPHYDIAKLSHSILGGYDFVNSGLFDLDVDDELRPDLKSFSFSPPWAYEEFSNRLEALNIPMKDIRLYEASLFLSMLPLHSDNPKKLFGFCIIAHKILSDLEKL